MCMDILKLDLSILVLVHSFFYEISHDFSMSLFFQSLVYNRYICFVFAYFCHSSYLYCYFSFSRRDLFYCIYTFIENVLFSVINVRFTHGVLLINWVSSSVLAQVSINLCMMLPFDSNSKLVRFASVVWSWFMIWYFDFNSTCKCSICLSYLIREYSTKHSRLDWNVLISLQNTSFKLSRKFSGVSSLRLLILILNFNFLIDWVCVFFDAFLPQCCSSRIFNPIRNWGLGVIGIEVS